MKGRPPKPTNIKVLQGTFRNDRANPKEPRPEVATGDQLRPPRWLDKYGRECWNEYVPTLASLGVLTVIDLLFFGAVCERWSIYRRASNKTKRSLTQETEANGRCSVPEISIAKDAFNLFKQGLEQFGCTPASRPKVKAMRTEKDPVAEFAKKKHVAMISA